MGGRDYDFQKPSQPMEDPMENPADEAVYSVSWRLRRTSTESAYVTIPVADDMVRIDAEGNRRIDVDRMGREAVQKGLLATVDW